MNENVLFLAFNDKNHLPTGQWSNEPDYLAWHYLNFKCILLREPKLGSWQGFVSLDKTHPFFGKTLIMLALDSRFNQLNKIHGGITFAGRFISSPDLVDKNSWMIGWEALGQNDLVPMLGQNKLGNSQIYRNLIFAKRETEKLVRLLKGIK
jgi:hypothetical protein